MRAKTKRIMGAAVGLGAALAVAIAAVTIPGYQALQPSLDPATVWVANSGSGQVAAANTQVQQLQDVTRVSRGAMRVEQDNDDIVLVDSTNGTLRTIEPAMGELGSAVPIPANAEVQVRNERVLVSDTTTGDLLVSTVQAIREGQPLGDPVLQLGRGSVAVLGETALFAASPGLSRVVEFDLEQEETTNSYPASMSATQPNLQMTALGDTWVLYDSTSGVMSTRSWSRTLDFEGVALQLPGAASGAVVFATNEGLIRTTLGASAEDVLISGMRGSPSAPLVREGCVYGAWGDGTAWNNCDEEGLINLRDYSGESELRIQARGSAVVATEPGAGSSWSLHGEGQVINDWLEPIDEQLPEGNGQQDYVPETDEEFAQQPPTAQDDEFGARPGRVTILPVTRNDSDPNNDPIIITEVTGHDGATVTPDGHSIRLELDDEADDTIDLRYTISDGRGGEDTADVTVTVRSEQQNAAPEQMNETTVIAQTGGVSSIDVLADWVDPDGDPLTLVSVAAESPDRATARPDGRLEMHDGGAGGVRSYVVTVSDGVETTEGTVTVSTTAKPQISAEPVTVSAIAGQTLEIEPLLSARGGDGPLRLHNVELPSELEDGEVAYDAGVVRFTPTEEMDVSFPYVVTDGTAIQQGTIRVNVAPAQTASTPPLPLPQAVALPPLGQTSLELANATADPSGRSLVVTSLESNHPSLRAFLADLGVVHLELTAPLEEPAEVTYELSNGTATAQGTISVSEGETSAQAPIARDDAVRAAPGQAVTIFPLANDEHPDLGPVTLLPELVSEPSDGVMFTRRDSIVFLAPEVAGTYDAVYEVEGPDGQRSTATVTVTVGESGGSTNQAPEAPNLHARVMAGQSVDIPVPLAGSDPNGDPVQLIGQSSTASLGTLSRVDANTFRYTATAYSSGTDEIKYLISDNRGAQSEGTLTIAVAPRSGVDAKPRAVADTAEMQPNSALAVDVLANDLDAANLPLSVADADVTSGDATVEVQEGAVVVHAGEEGEVGIMYVVENAFGEQSTAWLMVTVHDEAEPPSPVANDIDVPLLRIVDQERVTVRPLEVSTVADGRNDLLEVSIAGGGDDVEINADGSLSMPVRETAREFAYAVTRTDTDAAAYGIVRVPGTQDSLPQLRDDADPIRVVSGETVEIDINDYIIAATGQPLWITDASRVRATQGESNVRDSQTIEFTPTLGYHGSANVSLEVTDGESPQDPDGRVGLIVLPIEVLASDETPPTVLGTTLTLEPGQSRTIDLTRITEDPANRPDRLSYTILEQPSGDIELEQNGDYLTMTVAAQARPGSQRTAVVGVSSGNVEGTSGTLVFSVVSSTLPLVQPATDTIDIRRGSTQTLYPLRNDEATNPFPGEPLSIDALEYSTNGLFAEIGADNRVNIAVSGDARVQVAQVRYRVMDANGDPERAVWGTIRVRIQDAPDRPTAPVQITDRFERNTLFVQVAPPDENNSSLTRLWLRDQFGNEYPCQLSGECTLRDLDAGVNYIFNALAANEIGESEPSPQSSPMHVDALPNPVRGVRAQPTSTPGTMRLTWDAATVPSGGSAVNGYIVHVTGRNVDIQRQLSASTRAMNVPDLEAGRTYTVQIAATNSAGVSDDLWRYSDEVRMTAVGRPSTTTVAIVGNPAPGDPVTVQWGAVLAGGSTPVLYSAEVIDAASQGSYTCSSNGNGQPEGSSRMRADRLPVQSGRDNVVAVTADNGWFCSVSFSESIAGIPGAVSPGSVTVTIEVDGNYANPRVTMKRPLARNHYLEARVMNGTNVVNDWTNVSQQPIISIGRNGHGRSLKLEVRQCVAIHGEGPRCGDVTPLDSVVPFDLNATIPSGCTWGEVPTIQLPPNQVGARMNPVIEVLVGGTWQELPEDEPVPTGAMNARVWLTVQYGIHSYAGANPNYVPGESCGV